MSALQIGIVQTDICRLHASLCIQRKKHGSPVPTCRQRTKAVLNDLAWFRPTRTRSASSSLLCKVLTCLSSFTVPRPHRRLSPEKHTFSETTSWEEITSDKPRLHEAPINLKPTNRKTFLSLHLFCDDYGKQTGSYIELSFMSQSPIHTSSSYCVWVLSS